MSKEELYNFRFFEETNRKMSFEMVCIECSHRGRVYDHNLTKASVGYKKSRVIVAFANPPNF